MAGQTKGESDVDPSAPGWYPDPYGRHERRYWSGIRWSRHVEDRGDRAQEQPPERPVLLQRRTDDERGFGAEPPPRRTAPRHTAPHPRRRPTGPVTGGLAAVLVAVVGVALLATRGGDDGADPVTGDDPLVVAVVDLMHEKSGGTVTDADASCMAGALVDGVGADRLTELGVLDGTDVVPLLDAAEKGAALPQAFDCLDDAAMIAFISATWTAAGLGADLAPCVFQGWLDGVGRVRMVELYATATTREPPPLNEMLEPDELDLAAAVVAQCRESTPASAPAAAPATP